VPPLLLSLRSSANKYCLFDNNLVRIFESPMLQALYNKDHEFGLLVQIAAAHELGEARGRHKGAATAILRHAKDQFKSDPALSDAISDALARSELPRWKKLPLLP
jgi:hypothetical protein